MPHVLYSKRQTSKLHKYGMGPFVVFLFQGHGAAFRVFMPYVITISFYISDNAKILRKDLIWDTELSPRAIAM